VCALRPASEYSSRRIAYHGSGLISPYGGTFPGVVSPGTWVGAHAPLVEEWDLDTVAHRISRGPIEVKTSAAISGCLMSCLSRSLAHKSPAGDRPGDCNVTSGAYEVAQQRKRPTVLPSGRQAMANQAKQAPAAPGAKGLRPRDCDGQSGADPDRLSARNWISASSGPSS